MKTSEFNRRPAGARRVRRIRLRRGRYACELVDRAVALAMGLVGGQRAARHCSQDALCDSLQADTVAGAGGRIVMEPPDQRAVEETKIESTVLADHRVDRPHPGDVIAPPRRASGHRNHELPDALQALERGISQRGKLSSGSEGLVDVEKHGAREARVQGGKRLHWPITWRTRARCASFISSPHLVRRHSTSSALHAHSWSTK